MERHLDLAAGRDLRKLLARLGHDGLGAGLEVVVASADSLAEGVGLVTTEAGRVLLERVSPGAVTRSRGVDAESHYKTECVSKREEEEAEAGGSGNLLPEPPASPTALMMAPWPATSWAVATRPRARTDLKEDIVCVVGGWSRKDGVR